MNDKQLQGNSPVGQDFFRNIRNVVGYGVTHDVTGDWTRGLDDDFAAESVAEDDGLWRSFAFAPFDADARTTFLLNMNRGQLMADQDRMISASTNSQQLSEIGKMYDQLVEQGTDTESATNIIKKSDAYTKLVENGVFDDDFDSNINNIESLLKKNEDEYNDALEDYKIDLADIERHKKDHTVSAYYTRQVNKPNQDNWFYSQPTTLGLSSSSWKEQLASFAAGVGASAATGAIAGAAMGSVAPGPGTIAGSAAGATVGTLRGIGAAIGKFLLKNAVRGAIASGAAQVGGGMQAREDESHIEAFDAYSRKLNENVAEYGLDSKQIADNLRKQAIDLKYGDVDSIADNDLIAMAAADKRFKFDFDGGRELMQAMDDAFTGTRRVYEQNNALGAAEFATDMMMYTPLNPKGYIGKALGWAKGTKLGAKLSTPLDYLQNVTMKTGIDMSKFASKMRNKALWQYGSAIGTRYGLNYLQESTEEGAQGLIQKKFDEGGYDKEIANDSLIDAITDGGLISDMTDNLLFRTKSGLAMLGIGSEYKNDAQLHEEMFSGGLLSLLSPQSIVMSATNVYEGYKKAEQAYGMGKFIEEALRKDADINSYERFYRNMRKYGFASSEDYDKILENVRQELKSAKDNKDGTTTRKWGINTDALYKIVGPVNKELKDEDGETIEPTSSKLTDQQIDQFVDVQRNISKNLYALKKMHLDPLWKKFKSGNKDLAATDQDLFYTMLTVPFGEMRNAQDEAKEAAKNFGTLQQSLAAKSNDQQAFRTTWYNDTLFYLKQQKRQTERLYQEMQKMALAGELPMEVAEQQQKFMDGIDSVIEEREKEFKSYLKETGEDLNQPGLMTAEEVKQMSVEDLMKSSMVSVFNDGDFDIEDQKNYLQQREDYFGARAYQQVASKMWDSIREESPEKLKQRLDSFKKARNDKFKQSQVDGKTEQEQAALAKEQSSVRDWLKEATLEQVDTKREETKQQLDSKIKEFDDFVESVDSSTQLGNDLRNALKKANALSEAANNSSSAKVRALSLYIDQFLKQYEGASNEQSKQALDKLQVLQQILRTYNQLSDEAAAKRFQHPVQGKYLKATDKTASKVDTRTYTDNDGNVYSVDLSKSYYSEADGLMLAVAKRSPNVKQDRDKLLQHKATNDKILARLQKQLDDSAEDHKKPNANEDRIRQYRDDLRRNKKIVEDANKRIEQALKNLEVEQIKLIGLDSQEAKDIHYSDNAGKQTTLAEEYAKTNERHAKEAKEAKEKRLNRSAANRYQWSEIVSVTLEEAKRELGDLQEQNETSEIKKAIAYPIGDKNNAKATSILSSPYYQAKYWHGHFAFEVDPAVVDSWKSNDEDQKKKAKKAIAKMDKLVAQIAHLKAAGRNDLITEFLNEMDAMLQIPLDKQSKKDSVTLRSSDPAKPEYAVTLTRDELFVTVGFLPVTAYLKNERYGDGKLFVPLVVADLKKEAGIYSEDGKISTKFQWRYSMFKEFLKASHYKNEETPDPNDTELENVKFDDTIGFDDSLLQTSKNKRKEKKHASSITIKDRSIDISFEKYNQKYHSPEFNAESPIFYDAEGKRFAQLPEDDTLTPSQMTEYYKEQIKTITTEGALNTPEAKAKFAEDLSKILEKPVSVEELEKQYKDTDLTVLEHIILDAVRYGDGVILRSSFVSSVIETGIKSKDTKAQLIFEMVQDRYPNLFFSFNAPMLNQGSAQTITETTVAQRLQYGYFDKVGDIKNNQPGSIAIWIKDKDGQVRRVGDTKNPVKMSVSELTDIFQKIEEMVQGATPEQFFKQLEEEFGDTIDFRYNPHPSVKYSTDETKAFARNLISRYIRNRNFSRLLRPSNILDALNQGSDHPNNTEVQTERFNGKKGKVVNSRIDEISNLHVRSVNGVYYFDLAKYAETATTLADVDEEGNMSNAVTELEMRQKRYDDFYNGYVSSLKRALYNYLDAKGDKRSKAFAELMNLFDYNQLKGFKSSEGKFDDNGIFITEKTGENVNRTKTAENIEKYLDELSKEIKESISEIEQQLAKELIENATKEDKEAFIEGGKHARVQFAVGSFDEGKGKSTVLRSDGSGSYIPMVGVQGKPGAVYMIIPSWMTGSGKHRIVHLNKHKMAIHQATFIAKLLDAVRTGKLSYTGDITNPNVIDGFTVSTKYTVKQILEELINIGTKQAEFANDAATFAQLLFVDNQNNIHFGDKILDDTNLSDLISFIQDKKPMRVDRQRLLNEGSKVGISLDVKLNDDSEFLSKGITTDKEVFNVDENEEYQHYVIRKGIVTTTLNGDKKARLFTNVVAAISLTSTGNQAIPNPANKSIKDSPANKKEEAFTSKEDFAQKVNESETPASTGSVGKVSVDNKYVLATVNQTVAEPGRYWLSIMNGEQEVPLQDKDNNPLRVGQVGETLTSLDMQPIALSATALFNKPRGNGQIRQSLTYVLTDEKNNKHKVVIKRPAESAPVATENNQNAQPQTGGTTVIHNHYYYGNSAPASGVSNVENGSQPNQPAATIETSQPKQKFVKMDDSWDVEEGDDTFDEADFEMASITTEKPKPVVTEQPVKKVVDIVPGPRSVSTPPVNTELSLVDKIFETFVNDGSALTTITIDPKMDNDVANFNAWILQYAKVKGLVNISNLGEFTSQINSEEKSDIRTQAYNKWYPSYERRKGKFYGSVFNFLDEHVEKENVDEAIKRAEKILGKFDLKFASNVPFTYDSNRKASIYVFGQCSEAFIQIYKSAKGMVAAGTLDHEAFHKISLFVLSEKERNQMYQDIREAYPETANMDNNQVEEFAADLFKEFVKNSNQTGITGFYSKNVIIKAIQKLYDWCTKLIRKYIGINTHPSYRGLNKLFQDMYTGRYAFAKATKDNIELFNSAHSSPLFSGVKGRHGKPITRTAQEYHQVINTLINEIVNRGELLDVVHNYSDMSNVLDQVRVSLNDHYRTLNAARQQAFDENKFDNVVRITNLMDVYERMLSEENWPEWKRIVNDVLRHNFKISLERKDANEVLAQFEGQEMEDVHETYEDDTNTTDESDGVEEPANEFTSTISQERDSLQRNMWDSAALSVKIIFWTCKTVDRFGSKYNHNGMFNFENPAQMFVKFTELLQGCYDEVEMMQRLEELAKEDSAAASIYATLTQSENTLVNKSLQNKFFTSVCRYRHNFENNSYDVTEDKDGVTRVQGQIKNGNLEEVTTKARNNIMRTMANALSERTRETAYNPSKESNRLSIAINGISGITENVQRFKEKIIELLKVSDEINGFGVFLPDDIDYKQTAEMLVNYCLDKDGKIITSQVNRLQEIFRAINTNFTTLSPSSLNAPDVDINRKIRDFIDKNKLMQTFLKDIGRHAPSSPKLMSQTGPKNVRIYTVGAFNYITNLFKNLTNRTRNSNWLQTVKNNPYSENSVWLEDLEKGTHQLNTRLQTMNNDNYAKAKSDKYCLDKEEYINRMMTVLGHTNDDGHAFPVLANKKFSADLVGIKTKGLEQVFSVNPQGEVVIARAAKEVFAGYFMDELAAIEQAKQVRDNFINELNEALGTKHTIESFSALTPSQQEVELRALNLPEAQRATAVTRINNALKTLVVTYHFESSKKDEIKDKNGRIVAFNDSHIDLTKGKGYNHRHFANVAKELKKQGITEFDKTSANLQNIIEKHMLLPQIQFTFNDMISKNVIKFIPENILDKFKEVSESEDVRLQALVTKFVVRHMSDILEYEKLVQGDLAFYGKVDSMTKRYSGPVSTFGLNAKTGTLPLTLSVDQHLNLTENETYNALTIQTTKMVDYDVFEGLMFGAIGVKIPYEYKVGKKQVEVDLDKIDHTILLDENGKFKPEVANSPLGKLYVQGSTQANDVLGIEFKDEQLAKTLLNDAVNRYSGYLSQDYTDATTWISPTMFRELRQRADDGWNATEEACYLFMEHYHELYKLQNNPEDWRIVQNAANILGITEQQLQTYVNSSRVLYDPSSKWASTERNSETALKMRAHYRGNILSHLENENGSPKIDTTAMKYIHFGTKPQDNPSKLYIPVYDKTALVPLFRIFVEDHMAENIHALMRERNVNVVKYDSSTKSGGMFGYQLYDSNGNFNQALYDAPVAQQWFEQLRKQLETELHEHDDTTLLTQLTKVAMINSATQHYQMNGLDIAGDVLNKLYTNVFNMLTKMGMDRFKEEYGFNSDGTFTPEGKLKFANKLRSSLEQLGVSQNTINAIEIDEHGNFNINPALLPNISQLQTRLLSQIGKIIVDTHMKGMPLYQVVSAGFDKDHPLHKGTILGDKELLSPGELDEHGNVVKRLQCRISIALFNDAINDAKKNKNLVAKLKREGIDLDSFEGKRKFVLKYQDQLMSLAYRVPTQGQNSTMPIEIVDVLPATQGGIIMLPTTLTALTGADFDIDKLFTATYNYEVTDNGIQRVDYMKGFKSIEDVLSNLDKLNQKQLENILLDIYQTVLTSEANFLHTTTPLDVCTELVKPVMVDEIKNTNDKNTADGYALAPAHQVQMRVQNSGSDQTIGPMALNSVFQYYTQNTDLGFIQDKNLEAIGITGFGSEYGMDAYGKELSLMYVLDVTSAMINAAVDAAKDNYIGRGNINAETYDVINFLIAGGFGQNSFRFLGQPWVINEVNSKLLSSGDAIFKEKGERTELGVFSINKEFFKKEALKWGLDNAENYVKGNLSARDKEKFEEMQEHYVEAYRYFKSVAKQYRQAVTVAQVDTKKYGKNIAELTAFLQNVDDYKSVYNLLFTNPENLFEQTFLKEKLNGVSNALNLFENIFLENSKLFRDAADRLSTIFNKRGSYGKKFMTRIYPKMKQVIFKGFFDQYVHNRFYSDTNNNLPLYDLFVSESNSVVSRYNKIKQLCMQEGIGYDFFYLVTHAPLNKRYAKIPKFFNVNKQVYSDPMIKAALTDSITELFESTNDEVREWITDVAVMQFYMTGGTDTSFGGAIKSTFYDALPLEKLATIETKINGKTTTFNDYVNTSYYEQHMNEFISQTMMQLSISDDEFVPVIKAYGKSGGYADLGITGDGSVVTLRKASQKVAGNFEGSRYSKYIKVQQTPTSTPALYVLGNVVKTTSSRKDKKTGEVVTRTYFNPIYFRVNKLGYSQYSNRANSIRVDGVEINGETTSMFNTKQLAKGKDGKYTVFSATNLEELKKYAAHLEVDGWFSKAVSTEVLNVDELGNVLYDFYDGVFDRTVPANTKLVVSRLNQFPTDQMMKYINHAKEVGASFIQVFRNSDGNISIMGNIDQLNGEVSLLTVDDAEFDEVAKLLFEQYPGITAVNGTGENYMLRGKQSKRNAISRESYSRASAQGNKDVLYIFTDNTDRTSGGTQYGESWYKQEYGEGGYGSSNNPTSAVIRGLDNAAPISTMRYFYKSHPGMSMTEARWNDSDYDEFISVLNKELDKIEELMSTGKYNRMVLPKNGLITETGIAGITESRVPKIYKALKNAEQRLEQIANNHSSMEKVLQDKKSNKKMKNEEC